MPNDKIPGFLCEHPRSARKFVPQRPNHIADNIYINKRERVLGRVVCTKCGVALHERTEEVKDTSHISLASSSYRTSPKPGTEGYDYNDYQK